MRFIHVLSPTIWSRKESPSLYQASKNFKEAAIRWFFVPVTFLAFNLHNMYGNIIFYWFEGTQARSLLLWNGNFLRFWHWFFKPVRHWWCFVAATTVFIVNVCVAIFNNIYKFRSDWKVCLFRSVGHSTGEENIYIFLPMTRSIYIVICLFHFSFGTPIKYRFLILVKICVNTCKNWCWMRMFVNNYLIRNKLHKWANLSLNLQKSKNIFTISWNEYSEHGSKCEEVSSSTFHVRNNQFNPKIKNLRKGFQHFLTHSKFMLKWLPSVEWRRRWWFNSSKSNYMLSKL